MASALKFFEKFMEDANSVRLTGAILADDCVEIKLCPYHGVTNDGRIWRKGAGKRCSECALGHARFLANSAIIGYKSLGQ